MALMRFARRRHAQPLRRGGDIPRLGLIAAAGMLVGRPCRPGRGWRSPPSPSAGSASPTWCRSCFRPAGNQPGVSSGAGMSVVTTMGYSGILVAPSLIGFVGEQGRLCAGLHRRRVAAGARVPDVEADPDGRLQSRRQCRIRHADLTASAESGAPIIRRRSGADSIDAVRSGPSGPGSAGRRG